MFRKLIFKILLAKILMLAGVAAVAQADIYISEFHYDNEGDDVGEAIEIGGPLGADLSGWSVVLYNGSATVRAPYNTLNLQGQLSSTQDCGGQGYLLLNLPVNGIQNGSPDGLALVDSSGNVIQFISYEGSFEALAGPAAGLTSVDIGVEETANTAIGNSLQFNLPTASWAASAPNHFGTCATVDTIPTPTSLPTPTATPAPLEAFISEIHYDNDGADINEAIEIGGTPEGDISGWSLVLYNGNDGASYQSVTLNGVLSASGDCRYGYLATEISGIQNGSPDGVALVDASGSVVDFVSYEGVIAATNGPAAGLTSVDIGVAETPTTPVGESLQREESSLNWVGPLTSHFGSCTATVEPTLIPTPEPTPQFVPIHAIQGEGAEVAITSDVVVEAIVTADYQLSSQLSGFFIQEEDADADNNLLTSEGIFVYCGSCATDVAVGDLVRIGAKPSDYFGMSQLNATSVEILSSGNSLPSPALISLPVATTATDLADAEADIAVFYEAYEGMLVTISNEMFASEYYQLGRYGEIVLAADERFRQFTDVSFPSAQGWVDHQIDMAARKLILDDGSSKQNPDMVMHPLPGLTRDNYFRGGDSFTQLTGPLHYAFSKWRIQPVSYQINQNNPRTESPKDVGGSLKVASFNVLNFFTTLDTKTPICGPNENMDCRGANSLDELERQESKIVEAICAMDADIVGLMELQNVTPSQLQSPVAALVESINLACGDYEAIETGTLGTDAISVGVIYKPAKVAAIGTTAILDSEAFTDPNNTGVAKNRAALAQSFRDIESGFELTVAVNHLKSKGSSCGDGDDDTTMGQGNCNATRAAAAAVEAEWLASHPTGVESNNVLIIGDLNSYRNEDPITTFTAAGYVDLVDFFSGAEAYGYVFDGQVGYLDHALASDALVPFVSGVAEWHINADEINLYDYNSEYKPANYLDQLFSADPYRSSDHDPVIIGIELPKLPTCMGQKATVYVNSQGLVAGGLLDGTPYSGMLIGSWQDDVIVATENNDVIFGVSGKNLVCAKAGEDIVIGGKYSDTIYGEAGNDLLIGGAGADDLIGGEGIDTVLGGAGADRCQGEFRRSCKVIND